jgi:hypothetical protein
LSRASDLGLLALRLGQAACVLLLVSLPQAKAEASFRGAPVPLLGALLITVLLVALGAFGRIPPTLLAVVALGSALRGLGLGEEPLELPARAFEFSLLLAPLAIAGPGSFTIGRAREWIAGEKGGRYS